LGYDKRYADRKNKILKGDKMSNGTFKLSNQALGAVMMALQESLLNELDIVPILKGFVLAQGDEGLVVTNPPTVRVSNSKPITEEDLTTLAGE
tara:strand:- start:22 stop:300 length:279 start_codon:yes stop_codon:yes gene_type:complete